MSVPLVVDTHTHIVSADTDRYPLKPKPLRPGSAPGLSRPDWYETHAVSDVALMQSMRDAGVDRVVLVQAMGAYGYDNRYCADAAALHANRATSVAIVDPEAEDPASRLRHWVRDRGMRGVRLFAIGQDPGWLDGIAGFQLVQAACEFGVPVVATLLPSELPRLVRLLERFPTARVALDHCGFPDLRAGPPYEAASALFDLARFEQLCLKISGLLLAQVEAAGGRPADFVAKAASVFGAGRLMWGSDFPQTHDRSYRDLVALCAGAAADLDDDDRAAYLGGTALRLWPSLR